MSSTVSRSFLTFAFLGLALLLSAPGYAQIPVGTSMTVFEHPGPGQAFHLSEAYPGTSGTFTSDIVPNKCFSGPTQTTDNVKAVPGILCLARTTDTFHLNVNAFATCGTNEHDAFVQSYRLRKEIPGSQKCPNTYMPAIHWQFGGMVRTWWTLLYTQPGTKFVLEVTVRCLNLANQPKLHIDRWTWEVVATLDSFQNVIDALHQNTLGTLEIPCIVGEDMYQALVNALTDLKNATAAGSQAAQQDALFNMEALVIAYTAFGEFLDPDIWFPGGPPGNLAPMTPFAMTTGIVDTLENPCGCKLIVDLEFLGTSLGIVSP